MKGSQVLRQARVTDVPAIHALIGRFADEGRMLPRSRARLYETVRDFLVAEDEDGGGVVAVGALRTLWEDWGEVCSLAVAEGYEGKGLGTSVVENLLSQATLLGLGRVFVLTFIPKYFERFGFEGLAKGELPHKVWADCVNCPKFPDCGEQALVREMK
jgi:amino-acid N-acetyltransferase